MKVSSSPWVEGGREAGMKGGTKEGEREGGREEVRGKLKRYGDKPIKNDT